MDAVLEQKKARLRKTGGSRSVTIPLSWLQSLQIEDRVELTFTGRAITIEPPRQEESVEDRPEFAQFLDFLTKESLLRPEQLVNAAEYMAGDDDLFAGVETGSLLAEADGE